MNAGVSRRNRSCQLRARLRWMTALFMLGLVVSGATALPLTAGVDWLAGGLGVADNGVARGEFGVWLTRVREALHESKARFPFLFYGTDWLAFGHFAIAIAFVGAWRDPARNRWLYDFGLIACALVVPYALGFGALRGIPLWWRLGDCAFGVCGAVPLWLCRRWVLELERL